MPRKVVPNGKVPDVRWGLATVSDKRQFQVNALTGSHTYDIVKALSAGLMDMRADKFPKDTVTFIRKINSEEFKHEPTST